MEFYTSLSVLISINFLKFGDIKQPPIAVIILKVKILLLIGSCTAFKVTAEQQITSNVGSKKILWLSDKSTEELDLSFRGFEYTIKDKLEYKFKSIESTKISHLNNDSMHFDLIIASGDRAWELAVKLNNVLPKLGIGLSQHSVEKYSTILQSNHFLIAKEQSPQRIFAMLSVLDLNHSQAAALFDKSQTKEKFDFYKHSKLSGLPFKSINIQSEQNILKIIASVQDCCRVLYLKESDFQSDLKKIKSILIESYRRRIIVVGNRDSLLKLGAMYVIYTPDHEFGVQAANTVLDWSNGREVEPVQMPKQFVIDSNITLRKLIGGTLANQSIGDLTNKVKLLDSISSQDIKL